MSTSSLDHALPTRAFLGVEASRGVDTPRATDPNGPVIELDGDTPRARGHQHGSALAREIHARLEWLGEARAPSRPSEVEAWLSRCPPGLVDELAGIAEGADVAVSDLIALDLSETVEPWQPAQGAQLGPVVSGQGVSTILFVNGAQGPVLGVSRVDHADGPGECARHRCLRVRGHGSERDGDACLLWARPGSLGSAGLSRAGVAVAACELPRINRSVGRGWPACMRALVASPDVVAAQGDLRAWPPAGGAFFAIASIGDYAGLECGEGLVVRTQRGVKTAHVHGNQAFDPVLRRGEAVRTDDPSFGRMIVATTLYAQLRPNDSSSVMHFFDRLEQARPGGLPRQSDACILDLTQRSLLAWRAPSEATEQPARPLTTDQPSAR